MASSCQLTSSGLEAIQKYKEGSVKTVIFKCVPNKAEIVPEDIFEKELETEELKEELSETSPRIILHSFSANVDSHHIANYQILIYFNPMDTQVNIKRTYEAAFLVLKASLPLLKELQFNDLNDFTDVNLKVGVQGLSGNAIAALQPTHQRFGRECV